MKISKLGFQKQQQRINVYLDGVFAFGLNTAVALENHLKINQELGEKDIFKLLFDSLKLDLTSQAMVLISQRPHSVFEIKTYLNKRLYNFQKKLKNNISTDYYAKILAQPDTLINQIIDKMIANGFLDDKGFGQWWVQQRIASRPRGAYALRAELMQKGIATELINKIVTDKTILSRGTNSEMMDQILEKAWRSISHRGYDNRKLKQVLARRLISKGFSWEEVYSKIDDFMTRVVQ